MSVALYASCFTLSIPTRLNTGFNAMDVMVGAISLALALVNILILQNVFIVTIVLIHEMVFLLPLLTLSYFVVTSLVSARYAKVISLFHFQINWMQY